MTGYRPASCRKWGGVVTQLRGRRVGLLSAVLISAGCVPFSTDPVPGPDKQAVGTLGGAALGAGSGAVTGAQLAAGTGPGAWIGAGFGAIYGMLNGLGIDMLEEDQLRREEEQYELRKKAWAQQMLSEHFARRAELFPSRDIFPADIFFSGDSVELRPGADVLSKELAELSRRRKPWSRIKIAAYATSVEQNSEYAHFLTKRRAEEIALQFVKAGVEPRRLEIQAVTLREPLVIDPEDSPGRYRQAVEIIMVDK